MRIEIDTQSQVPIYEQLRDQVVFGIASKKLVPGQNLPSARKLAAELGVNFHTVNKAFALLADEGFIVMDRRKGAIVSDKISSDKTILSEKLKLVAAEALCRGMDDMNFVALCIQSFRSAKGEA